MKYGYVNGPVYCRYAATPPVINSELANEYGIEAPSFVELEQGRNVKVRIVLENRSKRLTCHAKIAWVRRDETAGGAFDQRWVVGLSPLSLADAEFEALVNNFVEKPELPLELRERLRDTARETAPLELAAKEEQTVRAKAVTMPVRLIEEIDAKRGGVPFSQFVVAAVEKYLKD